MILFKELIGQLNQCIDFKKLKEVIEFLSVEKIDLVCTPVFVDKLKDEFAESLTIMNDSRGYTLEFYKLYDSIGFLNFLKKEMVFKASIDQIARDNIFLTLFEPIEHKGISKIELISRKEIDPNCFVIEEVEAISISVNVV